MKPSSSVYHNRREFLAATAVTLAAAPLGASLRAKEPADDKPFELKYLVASCMYGYTKLPEILPELRKTGATAIDIWPKKHGNQREQLTEMGVEKFAELLEKHEVSLGCLTHYRRTPFELRDGMKLAKKLDCKMIVTAPKERRKESAAEAKAEIKGLLERLKPELAVAEENGVTVVFENHKNNILGTVDGVKWFAELNRNKNLGLAYAPCYLPQDGKVQAKIIREVGESIKLFYAWQHGAGSKKKQPVEQELLQMPGRGEVDFAPIVDALRAIRFAGWTEIFMHPYPRGRAILPTTAEVTGEINRSRKYLSQCLKTTKPKA